MTIDDTTLMAVDEALFAIVSYYQEVAPDKRPRYADSAKAALLKLREATGGFYGRPNN